MRIYRAPTLVGLLWLALWAAAGCTSAESDRRIVLLAPAPPAYDVGPTRSARVSQDAEQPALVEKSYAVGDLLLRVPPDFAHHSLWPRLRAHLAAGETCRADAGAVVPTTGERPPAAEQQDEKAKAAERFKRMIEREVRSGEPWQAQGGRATVSVDADAGKMVVRQTPAGHEVIRELLESIPQRGSIMVGVEARYVRTDLEDAKHLSRWIVRETQPDGPASPGGKPEWLNISPPRMEGEGFCANGALLNGTQAAALIKEFEAARSAEKLFAPRLALWNGQRSWLSEGTLSWQVLPLLDAPDKPLRIVGGMNGCVLDVRATVSADRRYVQLDLRPPYAALPAGRKWSWPRDEKGTSPWVGLPMVQRTHLGFSISVPDKGTFVTRMPLVPYRLKGLREVKRPATGEAALVPVWEPVGDPSEPQEFLWLLLRPTIIVEHDGPQGEQAGEEPDVTPAGAKK